MCGSKTVNNTTTTERMNDLPEWAKPYFERNIARAEAEFGKPYEAYRGERLAATDPNVTAGREGLVNVAGTGVPGLGAAQDYNTAGMQRATELGDYAGGNYSEFGYSDPATFTGANVSQYMSPYQQLVTDQQKEAAVTDFNRLQASRDAKAVQAGAFGGSRQAVQQGLAGEALTRQLAEIQASGQQQAYESAQGQFERDRAARESAERLGIGAAESASGQAAQMAQLGQMARDGDIQAASMLEKIGRDIQAEKQAGLDIAYEDFVRQRDYDREQLQFYSSILRGVPVQPSTETTKLQSYNPIQQLLGTGVSALGLYKGMGG